MKIQHLIRILTALTIVAIAISQASAQTNCDDIEGDAQITGGSSRQFRQCQSPSTSDFSCLFGTILSPNCGDAPAFGVNWFVSVLSVISQIANQCSDIYFSEVLKEITIKGSGASPSCEYNLEMKWKRGPDYSNPNSTSWTQIVSITADSQGNLEYEVTVPAKIHSQGNLVADEHILEDAVFKRVNCMEISGPSTVCIDDAYPITLSVSGGTAPYSWSSDNTSRATVTENNPDSTAEVKGKGQNGSVTITVTDDSGCKATKSISVTFDQISNAQELNSCVKKVQAPGNPTYNGCGPSGWKYNIVPDCITYYLGIPPFGPSGEVCFEPSCNAHDINYSTCGKSKSSSDTSFHNSMRNSCELAFFGSAPDKIALRNLCYAGAVTYYGAVVAAGGGPYTNAQIVGCVCCD